MHIYERLGNLIFAHRISTVYVRTRQITSVKCLEVKQIDSGVTV